MRPELFTISFIETDNALPARKQLAQEVLIARRRSFMKEFRFLRIGIGGDPIHDEDLPGGYRWS